MADRAITDFVEPVPEAMLEGKTRREQNEIAQGHRALERLRQQESHLATQAQLQVAKAETEVAKPIRRVPHRDPHKTIKVRVPKALQKTGTGEPSLVATSGLKPNKQLSALAQSAGSAGASVSFGKTERLATAELKEGQSIKNPSPSERIALLYTPSANIRTTGRNEHMRSYEFQVTYRAAAPPPPPKPVLRDADKGQFGADPQLSHFLPLDECDDAEFELRTPQEWVALGADVGGTPARSRWYGGETSGEGSVDEVSLKPCRVLAYDEDDRTFTIQWNHNGKQKRVRRLNVLFDGEDEQLWLARLRSAEQTRAQNEAQVRLTLYVESIPDELVTPIDEDLVDRILSLVAVEFPLQHLHVIEVAIEELRDMHMQGCKRAIHDYKYRSPEEKERLHMLGLAEPAPKPQPSLDNLLGTIDTPSPNFDSARAFCDENLFQTHALLSATIHSIHARWGQFSDHLLCEARMRGVVVPCELHKFEEVQNKVANFVSKRLKEDWSVNIITTIQNELDQHFNFFEENLERFEASRMYRFCRMVNIVMTSQLRQLIVGSITAYVELLDKYRIVLDDDFDLDADVVAELEEDSEERAYWEKRAEEILAVRARVKEELEAAEAKKNKGKPKAKKPVDDDEGEPEEEEEPEVERPALEFELFTNPAPYSRRMLGMARNPNGLEPLFVVRLISNGAAVMFSPLLEEVEDKVKGVFDNFFTSTDDIRGIGDQLFPLLGLKAYPLRPIDLSDPVVKDAKQQIQRIIFENMQAPTQLQQMYQAFEYILKVEIDKIVDSFRERNPPPTQAEYDATLERLDRDMERIRNRTLNEVKFELIKVECEGIKAALLKKARDISEALMDVLSQQLTAETVSMIEQYKEIHYRIGIDPKDPEELQELKLYIDGVPAKIDDLARRYQTVAEGNELLLRYKYRIDDDEFEKLWEAFEWPKKVNQVLEDSEFKYREHRNRFQLQLRADCEQLTESVAVLANDVAALATLNEVERAEIYYGKVMDYAESFKKYQDLITLYNSRETLFGMPNTHWSDLKEIKATFDPYYTLWEVAAKFTTDHDRWQTHAINDVDPSQVEQSVTEWSRKLNTVSKKLKEEAPASVCSKIMKDLNAFKPHVPLLRALHINLSQQHLKNIGKMIDWETINKDNPEHSLQALVKAGLPNRLSEVEEIADQAEKTNILEKQLDDMEAAWKKVSFTIEPHAETESHKLKASEEVQQLLDDQIQRVQVILGSPVVRSNPKLEDTAKRRDADLNTIQQVLDEWYKCQNVWSYLQPVFTSADIAKALEKETEEFREIDASWRQIMQTTLTNHQVWQRCQEEKLLPTFREHNATLDVILKKLHAFLETKRQSFPRFYFISNDELLRILSDSKDPFRVQPYLGKCFEGIKSIKFAEMLNIVAMQSAEGEEVKFSKKVNPVDYNNAVEHWLAAVENAMCEAVRDHIKRAKDTYTEETRTAFLQEWPGQVVIAVCSLEWTSRSEYELLNNGYHGLDGYRLTCEKQLGDIVKLVRRNDLSPVVRCTLEALIVIEVHAKDVLVSLVNKKVDSPQSFDWQAQLRYYWTDNNLFVCATNATLPYGYEYLGNTGRLVITELTDRCYRTLMGALHLNYGGAPEGPAGTGKTETTKDLAKATAKQCVVYNCSDQISYKDMAKLFKGLAQAGAWGCFDEFNRIEVQVLSVIAQQVATIQDAIALDRKTFLFDGIMINLKQGSAVFITMNPGYAGRAELPDNLKALFRPVAMMVPNYALIGEIQLKSYGFDKGRELAEKIVATYKLCSEQLSSQDHYDYGMRAVKSVLTAAGRLKRKFPDESEDILMLRSIQDVNLPKFLSQDVELFKGIVSDLFPGVTLPVPDYNSMDKALAEVAEADNLQLTDYFLLKVHETYEMIVVRHGMMLVGLSYGGKTKVLHSLAKALTIMHRSGEEARTRLTTLNPKAVTLNQLYGVVDVSGEWNDGVLSNAFRTNATDTSDDRNWLVLDGPVDAVWIENMNTVLDDNKKLCLTNGDIIPMSKMMNMIFEVADLAHASPATVSRCGMVYVEPDSLGWRVLTESYLATLPEALVECEPAVAALKSLIDWIVDPMLTWVRRNAAVCIPQGASVAVAAMLRLFDSFLDCFRPDENGKMQTFEERETVTIVEGWFLFSATWGLGGALYGKDRIAFYSVLADLLVGSSPDGTHKLSIGLPDRAKRTLFDCTFQMQQGEGVFVDWLDTMPDFTIPETAQYHEVIVPTADTERYSFLLNNFILHGIPCLLVGDTGTGKTVMVKRLLAEKLDRERFVTNLIQFSAQTSANQTQELIEAKADVRRKKGVYGPPVNKKLIVFVDDLNMPQVEEYGAQPPIELIRQWLDHSGWYNHKKDDVSFRRTEGLLFLAAMGPPDGGRNHTTPRLTRHFNTIAVPSFDDNTLRKIFCTLTDWIIARGFPSGLRSSSHALVGATIEVYQTLIEKLKPTPEKSHYTFNLRDVSKVFQGIAMANPAKIVDQTRLFRLWAHEVSRAFADRFINDTDSDWFVTVLDQVMQKEFKMGYSAVVQGDLLYSDFLNTERSYEEVEDMGEARKSLEGHIDAYNDAARSGRLDLVVFKYVIDHVSRISRILRQPFGHALLVGVGGSGRTSCTKLACKINDYSFSTVTVTKGFGHFEFLEAVKKILVACAKPEGIPTAFFVNDTHIVKEAFLEDICNLLNTGEIPGLMPMDELDTAANELKNVAKEAGIVPSRENLHALWYDRCRTSLHVVMAFSPIGSTLRERLRKFPSLVNCTTIDWFRDWPEDGLRNVAARFLNDIELSDEMRGAVCDCFVQFQTDVKTMAVRYHEEARQRTYVTPTSYIELLDTFGRVLERKRTELTKARDRYDGGLDQLSRTAEEVDRMKQKLDIMKPELKRKAKEAEDLIEIVSRESEEAEKVRSKVAVEEAAANETAKKADGIKQECQSKVAEAQPKLDEAQEAARSLDINALREVKALGNPPELVKFVIEACCNLLGKEYKPAPKRNPQTGKLEYPYWQHAQQHLMTNNFKDILLSFDVDAATEAQIQDTRKYIDDKRFDPVTCGKTSKALPGIVKFVIASEQFYQLNKLIKPLKADQEVAEREYEAAMANLKEKMDMLAKVDAELAEKQAHLDKVKREKQELEDSVMETDAQLRRANQLMTSLGGEKTRYAEESKRLQGEFGNVLGDVVMSSAMIAYLGPFQNKYRQEVLPKWVQLCKSKNIPGTDPFNFEVFLGNPLHIQDWKLQGLPTDSFSIANAIIMHNARRYPLLVDPQQQANKWIRNMEASKDKNNLVVVRPNEGADFLKKVCRAVREGKALLIENIEEELDAVLENLLLKRVVREGSTMSITIGDAVEWNDNFRMYITTKLPRPHYQPEVSTKVALCNFMITPGGLMDQLLGKVVAFERPDVEAKKQKMTIEMAQVRTNLKQTEDEILALLASDGNLLANESAIQQLDRARIQSQNAENRSKEIAVAEKNSEKIRNVFRPVAHLGSSLFFCVTELANIDPMYQYSLQFYMGLFQGALRDSEKGEGQERIDAITYTFQRSLYTRVCRGLFAKDQLLFSFIMALKMFDCDPLEVRWLLLGGIDMDKGLTENPFDWLPDLNWRMVWRATTQLPAFNKFERIIRDNADDAKALFLSPNPLEMPLPGELEKLEGIHRLIVLRTLRSDKMVTAVQSYVQKSLGDFFVEAPLFNLEEVSGELSDDPSVPIIFILSPGADPNTELDRVANIYFKGNGPKRLTKLSLGQGQDGPAEAMIEEGMKVGNWVLLQNCHLFKDFMPTLALTIENYSRDDVKNNLHRDYRLWLTSMPSEYFPVAVLQNGAKLVQEPPKGLKTNLLRSYLSDPISDEAFFNKSNKPQTFRTLLFGLCFFHSLVQERRKFGPLGFNIPYEFNDTDMRISVRQLMMFVNENVEVPFDAIKYLAGQCNYGGRVTDEQDRTCLMALLNVFYTPDILTDGYKFSPSGDYAPPAFGDHAHYVEHIRKLPLVQTPEVFGLHLNADITKDEREAKLLMDSVLATQPREASGGSGADPKTIVLNMAADIYARMPKPFNAEDVMAKHPITYEQSMNTVLLQECIRYNRLIVLVRKSMHEVQRAIKGEVVMGAELEGVFNAMFDGRIPPTWKKRSYPSLKPFGAYINDLIERLSFLQRWIDNGPPPVFWISGFFFTQSFLTGVKQNYARKTKIEIDKLQWDFTVMAKPSYDEPPADGCFVNGLFLEGAGWDHERRQLCESKPKELFVPFPIIQLTPALPKDIAEFPHYPCPTYKTTDRRGVLSTTGHSTNFIMPILLPRAAETDKEHWIKRGVALFTQLEY